MDNKGKPESEVEAEGYIEHRFVNNHILNAPGVISPEKITEQPGPGTEAQAAYQWFTLLTDSNQQGAAADYPCKQGVFIGIRSRSRPGCTQIAEGNQLEIGQKIRPERTIGQVTENREPKF